MSALHSPVQQVRQAKQLAEDNGMYIVEKSGMYQVFRKSPTGAVYLGRRSAPSGLFYMVNRLVTVQ